MPVTPELLSFGLQRTQGPLSVKPSRADGVACVSPVLAHSDLLLSRREV